MASHKKRVYLTLEKKVELIKHAPGHSLRSLEAMFGCGKTQISKVLKNKETILAECQHLAAGFTPSVKLAPLSILRSMMPCINGLNWQHLRLSLLEGHMHLIEKAKMIANALGKSDFKGSQGWLEKWKKRFAIKQVKICGESGDVQGQTVDSWKERIPELIRGYSTDDIWNMDETGLFFRALPDRGFAEKSQSCKGGKKSKLRVTIALFVSASGHKEKPVFIWKSENPRCLRGFDKSCLPVTFYSQKAKHGCLEQSLKTFSLSSTDA